MSRRPNKLHQRRDRIAEEDTVVELGQGTGSDEGMGRDKTSACGRSRGRKAAAYGG